LLGAEQCDDHAKSHSQDGKHLSSAKQPCLPAARATDGTPQDTSDNMAAHTGDNGHSVTIASDSATTQGAESDSNTQGTVGGHALAGEQDGESGTLVVPAPANPAVTDQLGLAPAQSCNSHKSTDLPPPVDFPIADIVRADNLRPRPAPPPNR